ncbi:MAG: uroporphyrinogen decarboxylase [Gammaproteobacteria bacterium]|nr:uroporphyrinogen decarboxylase [Gammaproteobacteria bacterium]MCP5200745.1 uroporphyrinogen decarboxylase [Gammaproteobacteria bacterium]
MNDRFLRALRREPVDCTPVWIMRQAGRYLPEYRATRGRAGDFLTLCKTPELACEVTLQPLARFALDAAILFSDILTIPDAMGLGLSLDEGVGPRFAHPVRDRAAIDALPLPDPEQDLGYVTDAVRLIKRELDGRVPLIGFAGSPWTLATYMVEGGGSRDFARVKALAYGEPQAAHALLTRVADATALYLQAQIAAGVDAVMLFDTWGGALAAAAYVEFSLAYMERILAQLPAGVPTILFTKGGGVWLERIAASGASALGVDWTVDLGEARRRVGDRVALQGNLDPAIMLTNPEVVATEACRTLDAFGAGPGHVFNLGHGITPQVPPEHVGVLVDTVHEYSRRFHQDTP